MNDYLGPMLYGRHEDPSVVTDPIRVVRADAKPGLFVFRNGKGAYAETVYLNNGPEPIPLPGLNPKKVGGINRGLDLEEKTPSLLPTGYLTVLDRA